MPTQTHADHVTAYPLTWPLGWSRTPRERITKSQFGSHSMIAASREVIHQLRLLGATSVVISTNVELRNDGLPYSSRRPPEDAGAAVYFSLEGRPLVLACDAWKSVEENLWAIARDIDAQRGRMRWRVGSVERAFAGYDALPPPAGSAEPWWEILGVGPGADQEEIKAAYRKLAKENHPDAGGDASVFIRIQAAYEAGLRGDRW